MNKYFYIIILVTTLIVSGCSTQRGGSGVVSSGVVSDDVFIADSIKKIETDEALRQETHAPYASFTEATADTDNTDPKIFTLQGLAVQGDETTNYTGSGALGWSQDGETIINVATIAFPAVTLTFDGEGNISGVKAYFANRTYDIERDDGNSPMQVSATNIDSGAQSDATIAKLTVDREQSFGFASNYMVHIGWNLERTQGDANQLVALGSGKDRSYSINGNMIAGIETEYASIPDYDTASFIGKGRGFYTHVSDDIDSYATIFDVTTDVNFVNRTISINSAKTMQCSDKNKIGSCTTGMSFLDFSTQGKYSYVIADESVFAGVVSLKDAPSFLGTIDVRFYGGNAQELGGIFAMRDETGAYYYGAFGGERDGITVPSVFHNRLVDEEVSGDNVTVITNAIAGNGSHGSLTDAADAGDAVNSNMFTVKALSVYIDDNIDYTRTPNRTWDKADKARVVGLTRASGSAVSLTFDGSSDIDATLYLNDIYTGKADRSTVFGLVDDKGTESEDDDEIVASNYMAYISWNARRKYDNFDNASPNLTDKDYTIGGVTLAGIETADSNIPLSETLDFTGNGRGTYGSYDADNVLVESYDAVFDVTATVNFEDKNVRIISLNSCKVVVNPKCDANGIDRQSQLNFSTQVMLYNDQNNISGDVTSNDDVLAGTVDARFYGNYAAELGGTFALVNNEGKSHYYGVFGAKRGYFISSETVETKVAGTPAENFKGLTVFTDSNRVVSGVGKTDIALKTTAVEIINNSADKTIINNRITGAVVQFDYDADGNVADNGLRLYFADKKYRISDGSPAVDGTGDAPDEFGLSRSSDDFGFEVAYMARVLWDVNQLDYKSYGYAMTGFETDSLAIPSSGFASFTGRGAGQYYSVTDSINVWFNTKADVNFTNRTIKLTSDTTCSSNVATNCAQTNYQQFALNFTSNLSYDAGEETLTGTILSAGDDSVSNSRLTGTAQARFYGAKLQEFGGTFNMALNGKSGYVGWFGGERDYLISTETLATIHTETPETFNKHELTSFNDDARKGNGAGTTGNAFAIDNAVLITRNTNDSTITNNIINGAVAEFDYADNGDFNELRYYYANKKYQTGSDSTKLGVSVYDDTPISDGADMPKQFHITRQSFYFGFTSTYMAEIQWRLDQDGYNSYGYGIMGFATDLTSISTTATAVNFTGRGRGQYYTSTASDSNYLVYGITANVNFATRNVTLTGTHEDTAYDYLDFTGNLSYEADTNVLTGTDWETTGDTLDVTKAKLFGGADAKFYGPLLQELGGTFSLTNETAGYVGYFGAQRQTYLAFNEAVVETTYVGTPETFNANNLTSFTGDDRKGTSNNVLAIDNAVSLTKHKTDKTITYRKITGAVTEFDYQSNGAFAENGLRLYFADKKYSVTTPDDNDQDYAGDNTPDRGGIDTKPGYFGLTKESRHFRFAPNYMVWVYWVLNEDDYIERGFTTTGYETAGVAIPSPTSNIIFKGEGHAQYYSENFDEYFEFGITANVNFATRNVTLTSSGTCIHRSDPNNVCVSGEARPALDFTGNLSYVAGENILTGTIETAGDDLNFDALDGTELTGTADARFYGGNVQEFGGVFSLNNATAGFAGMFGAEREYFTVSGAVATTHADTPTTFNQHNLVKFTDKVIRISKENNAFKATAVQITKSKTGDNHITYNKITGAVVDVDFDSGGYFSHYGLRLYVADKKYSVTDGNRVWDYINDSTPDAHGDDIPDLLALSYGGSAFRVEVHYMTRVLWELDEDDYKSYGYAVAGFETTGTAIPSTGTNVSFTGGGRGQYYTASTELETYFVATAEVNFATRNIGLTTTNTCSNYTSNCESENQKNHLDFTGTLTYAEDKNIITGSIKTKGDDLTYDADDGTELTGTAEARFYGPAAEEFGGTFSLTNATTGYIGYFGVKKD